MKKFMIAMLATLCAAVLSVAVFAGCGGKKEGGTPSGGDNPPVTTPDEDDETTPGGEEDKEPETPTYTRCFPTADLHSERQTTPQLCRILQQQRRLGR